MSDNAATTADVIALMYPNFPIPIVDSAEFWAGDEATKSAIAVRCNGPAGT